MNVRELPYSASQRPSRTATARRHGAAGAVLFSAFVLLGCGDSTPPDGTAGTGGTHSTAGTGGMAGSGVAGSAAGTGGLAGTGGTSAGNAGSGGSAAASGSGGAPAAGSAGAGSGGDGLGGMAGGGTGGLGGQAGSAGMGGMEDLPPAKLSETGLFSMRAATGELMLAEGVREFEPKYWLWSDGTNKQRYIYLPPGSKIDTTDPDHWVFPVGTKLWKSFSAGAQLVETRLLERIGEEPNHFRYATYYWKTADATDADREEYLEKRIDAAGTTHDIPNGKACERCHNALEDHALGFSALQLNHDRPGVTLATLNDEGWLTTPIPLTIKMPGDQQTQDALGYLHANCGNCHNDRPGLPVENVPEPQLLLRVSVNDMTLEDTDTFLTAINQRATASEDIGTDYYRIMGGNIERSVVWYRMNQRGIEYQMPPIGTEMQHMEGLELIQTWIQSLPAPAQ